MNKTQNERTTTVVTVGGASLTLTLPVIAMAFGWCTARLHGGATFAGKRVTVQGEGSTFTVTLDGTGSARFSLLPIIRKVLLDGGAFDVPLPTDPAATDMTSPWCGEIVVSVSAEGGIVSTAIPFRYGGAAVYDRGERWLTYDPAGESFFTMGVDAQGHVDEWLNATLLQEAAGGGDFDYTAEVEEPCGAHIMSGAATVHFKADCRTVNVLKVKWLDGYGGINERKLTLAGDSVTARAGESYERPHDDRAVSSAAWRGDYYAGDDRWTVMEPARTLTLGDDGIPMNQRGWLATLAVSPCVEVLLDGVWTRCNIAGCTLTADPRKSTFSFTITLTVPTHMAQTF